MIQVLERGLRVLEIVAAEPETPRGLGVLAAAAGLNAATCARILQTLVAAGYVEQVGRRQGYRLGPMAYTLAARGPYRQDLVLAAEPPLRELADQTGEIALLAVMRQGRRFVLTQVDSGHGEMRRSLEQVYDPYRSASGRLLLAHLPAAEREAAVAHWGLPGDRWPEVTGEEGLRRELDALRAVPWLLVARTAVGGVAVPVWADGRVVAVVGSNIVTERMRGPEGETTVRRVQAAATAIGETLERRGAASR